MQRLKALGCMPPDLTMSHRALESIFGTVFDKAEPQLHMRWIMLKNRLGLPHVVTPEAFKEVSEFADAELSALVLLGGHVSQSWVAFDRQSESAAGADKGK